MVNLTMTAGGAISYFDPFSAEESGLPRKEWERSFLFAKNIVQYKKYVPIIRNGMRRG